MTTNEYSAMPVEGEQVANDPRGPGAWAALKWPGVLEGYQISDLGAIRSPEDRPLHPGMNGKHLYVTLRTADKKGRGLRVDKLVLATFVGEPEGSQVPVHKDGDLKNCRLDNLEYGPPSRQELAAYTMTQKRLANREPAASKARPRSKGRRPQSKADYDVIDVSRTYRHRGTGLSVTVGENGKAKMPKLNMTAAEMRAMSLLSQRIAEMNEILGLGR
jgi:hypothetical protein